MKISLPQYQIGIRQRGLHSFRPCDNGEKRAHLDLVIMAKGARGEGGSSRPCDND